MTRNGVSTVILAAGESRRLGQPKQLLKLNSDETLLERCSRQLSQLGHPPLIVLGAYWQEIIATIPASLPFVVINPEWHRGMSSSLAAALQRLPEDAQGLLISVCDQPRIPDTHYAKLVARFDEDPNQAVATLANQTIGVPAIVPARAFSALSSVDGDKGARAWLRSDSNLVTVSCPQAAADIDTVADLNTKL